MRLRFEVTGCPRRALILTDTPNPRCPKCEGDGGWERHVGHPETGEYEDTHYDLCDCWDPDRRWTILPLPRARRTGYSDEPPF